MCRDYKLADRSLNRSTQFAAVPWTEPKRYSTDSVSSETLKMFAAHLVLALGVGRMMAAVNPDNPDGDHIPFRKMPSRARFRAISLQPETTIKPIKIVAGSERAAATT